METQQARRWRWLILVSAFLETFLFGGMVFGWGSLVFVLKQEGVFAHLCDGYAPNVTDFRTDVSRPGKLPELNQSDVITVMSTVDVTLGADDLSNVTSDGVMTCVRQDDMLSLCFSVTSAILYGATSIAGFISYKFGTRVSRLAGWVCFNLGAILVAFTSPDNPWLLFGGLAPLGFGGVTLLITNIQLAHEQGFRRRDSFLVLCGLHVLTLGSTVMLMPRTHFTWSTEQHCVPVLSQDVPTEAAQPLNDLQHDQTPGSITDQKAEERCGDQENGCPNAVTTSGKEKGNLSVPSLRDCLLSTMFLLEVTWMALLQLRFSFFLASFNPWLSSVFDTEEEVSHYTNVLLYSMMVGLPIALLSGAAFDFFKYVFAGQPVARNRHVLPSVVMLAVTSSLAVLLSVCALLPTNTGPPAPVFTACLLSSALRSFLYSVDANIIALMFPPIYLTALFSVCDFVGGVFSLLQYAFVLWFQAAGFHVVNSVMLAMSILTLVHPAVQLFRATVVSADHHSTTDHRPLSADGHGAGHKLPPDRHASSLKDGDGDGDGDGDVPSRSALITSDVL
ncbi:equilibrative nucleobase transporter 1-like isoform X2 [Babylonia areolata]|uniref:equilibrative nucleobase transporter 1-like isoform X2 n=1 Tax=Babylonia areolata TaxID=304850 RepID=UPI003FD41570